MESGRLKMIQRHGNLLPIETCVVSTECVLIDIVTISIDVGTGWGFPHNEVGTKSHHIKIYNRLTISSTVYVHSRTNS